MSPRGRASGVALALAIATFASVALPLAASDHEFSHRIEVFGRAIDALGRPASGAPLALELHGANHLGVCYDTTRERADEQGDFHLCRHVHDVRGPLEAVVAIGNDSVRVAIDPLLRRTFVALRLDEPWPTTSIQGEREFARTFVVSGRVVEVAREPVAIEAVFVNATPYAAQRVEVTLTDAEGALVANASASPSTYGDYRVELPVTSVPEGARVRVEIAGERREADAPADLRRADVAVVMDAPTPFNPSAPGAGTGVPSGGALVAFVGLAAAGWMLGRRSRG